MIFSSINLKTGHLERVVEKPLQYGSFTDLFIYRLVSWIKGQSYIYLLVKVDVGLDVFIFCNRYL